eukprot:10442322-Alexandrium_andersonii.AAC.1
MMLITGLARLDICSRFYSRGNSPQRAHSKVPTASLQHSPTNFERDGHVNIEELAHATWYARNVHLAEYRAPLN